ncbi:MAG: pitrilysin family protein [Bacteroidota bacterium]|nr:pitrilysin family protein [Bacteroidota bacterium]
MHLRKQKRTGVILSFLFFPLFLSLLNAQTFEKIKEKVKEHTLNNGMKFIVLERNEAPVVSFHIYADVGSAQESYGITGISHILEHMAFKGTKTVGTKDFEAESKVLDKLDKVYDQLSLEKKAVHPDSQKISTLQNEFQELKKEAREFIKVGEYWDMYDEQGGSGLNAYTSTDATQYIVSLPSNRLEFWMAMESDRFMNPLFREFFEERDVIMEERRLGVETQPTGKLFEDFFSVAFKSHPYHHEVVGHMSDLKQITRNDVKEYFKKYYSPSNLTVAIVGDVKAEEVFRLADLYFARIPSGPKPEPLRTEEPEQWGERHVTVEAQAQPLIIVGYHRPGINSSDDIAFDAMANIFGQGRSSRLFSVLVKEKKIAVYSGSFNGWPGTKYPNLFAVYCYPAKDHSSDECLKVIDNEISKLINESITEEELSKYKHQTKKWMYDGMKENSRMAASLTFNDVVRGDWRLTFDIIKAVDAITIEDVKAVARKYLVNKNRTIGEIIPEGKGGAL